MNFSGRFSAVALAVAFAEVHVGPPMKVEFRNIRLKTVPGVVVPEPGCRI